MHITILEGELGWPCVDRGKAGLGRYARPDGMSSSAVVTFADPAPVLRNNSIRLETRSPVIIVGPGIVGLGRLRRRPMAAPALEPRAGPAASPMTWASARRCR